MRNLFSALGNGTWTIPRKLPKDPSGASLSLQDPRAGGVSLIRAGKTKVDLRSALEIELRRGAFFRSHGSAPSSNP